MEVGGCGEAGGAKREERSPMGGGTVRMKGGGIATKCRNAWSVNTFNPCISEERKIVKEESCVLFPVTEVDEYMRGLMGANWHTLSKQELWDEIPDALLAQSLSCKTMYDRYDRQQMLTFEVPVVGHILMAKEKDSEKKAVVDYLDWGGRRYTRDRIYLVHEDRGSYRLADYGPAVLTMPCFTNASIKALPCHVQVGSQPGHNPRCRINQRQGNFAVSSFYSTSHNAIAPPTAGPPAARGYVLDLHRPCLVTHIALAGAPPAVSMFPQKLHRQLRREVRGPDEADQSQPAVKVGRRRARRHRKMAGRKRKPAQGWVYALDEPADDVCWVTSFDLYYRCLRTGRWVHLGRHTGNSDALTLRLVELPALEAAPGSLAANPRAAAAAAGGGDAPPGDGREGGGAGSGGAVDGGGRQGGGGGGGGLRARQLRVVPVDFHGPRPAARLAVYGLPSGGGRGGEGGGGAGEETVQYTLSAPPSGRFRHDGAMGDRRWTWDFEGLVVRCGERRRGVASEAGRWRREDVAEEAEEAGAGWEEAAAARERRWVSGGGGGDDDRELLLGEVVGDPAAWLRGRRRDRRRGRGAVAAAASPSAGSCASAASWCEVGGGGGQAGRGREEAGEEWELV